MCIRQLWKTHPLRQKQKLADRGEKTKLWRDIGLIYISIILCFCYVLLFFIYIFCDVNICRLTDQCDIAFYLKIVSWHVRTQTVTVCDTSAVSMVMKVYCRSAHLLQCDMKGRVKSTILNGNVTEVVPWHLMYHVTNVPEKARKNTRTWAYSAMRNYSSLRLGKMIICCTLV